MNETMICPHCNKSTDWVWGRNDYGQLGDGTTINKFSPAQVGSLTNGQQLLYCKTCKKTFKLITETSPTKTKKVASKVKGTNN